MGKSCKEIAHSLMDCMKNTQCMKNGGDLRSCMKDMNSADATAAGGDLGAAGVDCQELRAAYFTCKRGGLDMRSRIRGQRVF
jgi:hypothetical protein